MNVNSLHTGAVATVLGKQNGWAASGFLSLVCHLMRTPAKGADIVVWLARDSELERVSGKYFVGCREKRGSREPSDVKVAKRLCKVREQLTHRST